MVVVDGRTRHTYLNARIAPIRHQHHPARVYRDAGWSVELTVAFAVRTELETKASIDTEHLSLVDDSLKNIGADVIDSWIGSRLAAYPAHFSSSLI